MNEEFFLNLKTFSNEKICEIIATSRYLGTMREELIACMEELAARRLNGDLFNFEEIIEKEAAKLPAYKDIDLKKKLHIAGNLGLLKGLRFV